jgi:hypothetical protein
MEETRPKRPKPVEPPTREELIVDWWRKLGRPAVGAHELSEIQRALDKRFGRVATNSPAAIARALADEGADLLHPQVIECDALWRGERMRDEVHPEADGPLTLSQAEELIEKLEQQRNQSSSNAQSLRSIAIEARQAAERNARRKSLNQRQRAEQQEVTEWLGVWIKTPGLFKDWLELRKRSADFRKKFSE